MRIDRLHLHSFRRFAEAELLPGPGFNLITGDNGSGKSTILEALHLLGHGRSFRGRVRDGLIRRGDTALNVYAEWQLGDRAHRAGLRHSGGTWEARLDGSPVSHLGELCEALAVVTFEPGSHALIDGPSEGRRRYLDWGLFHVERADRGGDFLLQWRRHARALRQRNALLRQHPRGHAQLDAWEHELADAGQALTLQREAHVARLQPHLDAMIAAVLPAAGAAEISLAPGWRREEVSLADALLLARDRDLQQGHTSVGPHRADLRLVLRELPGRDGLSRGQTKLAALSLLLAQAAYLAEQDGHWPVLQLDDLASELDRHHQARVLGTLHDSGAQIFVTGTETPDVLKQLAVAITPFHVEQGVIVRA